LFESDGTIINRIAGVNGTGGYNPSDHGNAAQDASLIQVNHVQEDFNGDLLIWDDKRLRRVTVTTESGNPKIYDVINYQGVLGFSVSSFYDVFYDESDGYTYFIDSAGPTLKKAHPTHGTSTINLTGAFLAGIPRIAKTSIGLLVLDPQNRRILKCNASPETEHLTR
jgi:hypothetical protein